MASLQELAEAAVFMAEDQLRGGSSKRVELIFKPLRLASKSAASLSDAPFSLVQTFAELVRKISWSVRSGALDVQSADAPVVEFLSRCISAGAGHVLGAVLEALAVVPFPFCESKANHSRVVFELSQSTSFDRESQLRFLVLALRGSACRPDPRALDEVYKRALPQLPANRQVAFDALLFCAAKDDAFAHRACHELLREDSAVAVDSRLKLLDAISCKVFSVVPFVQQRIADQARKCKDPATLQLLMAELARTVLGTHGHGYSEFRSLSNTLLASVSSGHSTKGRTLAFDLAKITSVSRAAIELRHAAFTTEITASLAAHVCQGHPLCLVGLEAVRRVTDLATDPRSPEFLLEHVASHLLAVCLERLEETAQAVVSGELVRLCCSTVARLGSRCQRILFRALSTAISACSFSVLASASLLPCISTLLRAQGEHLCNDELQVLAAELLLRLGIEQVSVPNLIDRFGNSLSELALIVGPKQPICVPPSLVDKAALAQVLRTHKANEIREKNVPLVSFAELVARLRDKSQSCRSPRLFRDVFALMEDFSGKDRAAQECLAAVAKRSANAGSFQPDSAPEMFALFFAVSAEASDVTSKSAKQCAGILMQQESEHLLSKMRCVQAICETLLHARTSATFKKSLQRGVRVSFRFFERSIKERPEELRRVLARKRFKLGRALLLVASTKETKGAIPENVQRLAAEILNEPSKAEEPPVFFANNRGASSGRISALLTTSAVAPSRRTAIASKLVREWLGSIAANVGFFHLHSQDHNERACIVHNSVARTFISVVRSPSVCELSSSLPSLLRRALVASASCEPCSEVVCRGTLAMLCAAGHDSGCCDLASLLLENLAVAPVSWRSIAASTEQQRSEAAAAIETACGVLVRSVETSNLRVGLCSLCLGCDLDRLRMWDASQQSNSEFVKILRVLGWSWKTVRAKVLQLSSVDQAVAEHLLSRRFPEKVLQKLAKGSGYAKLSCADLICAQHQALLPALSELFRVAQIEPSMTRLLAAQISQLSEREPRESLEFLIPKFVHGIVVCMALERVEKAAGASESSVELLQGALEREIAHFNCVRVALRASCCLSALTGSDHTERIQSLLSGIPQLQFARSIALWSALAEIAERNPSSKGEGKTMPTELRKELSLLREQFFMPSSSGFFLLATDPSKSIADIAEIEPAGTGIRVTVLLNDASSCVVHVVSGDACALKPIKRAMKHATIVDALNKALSMAIPQPHNIIPIARAMLLSSGAGVEEFSSQIPPNLSSPEALVALISSGQARPLHFGIKEEQSALNVARALHCLRDDAAALKETLRDFD